MGTLQDKLLYALDPVKRILRDEKIRISGNEFRAIQFTTDIERDIFGDTIGEEVSVTSREIPVIISNLDEIPLSRLRKDLSVQQTTSNQSLYLYDVLPLTLRTRFDSQIEKDDILVIKIYDERNVKGQLNKPFYLTLQITEIIGYFSPRSLTNLQFNASPYIHQFHPNVINYIESF